MVQLPSPAFLLSGALFLLAVLILVGVVLGWRFRQRRHQRQQEQAQDRLRHLAQTASQEERRRRQARMTHDLKAPIHALLGMADLLAESALNPTQTEQVGTLRNSAEFLLALVRDILDLERLESGALAVRQEDFSLRRLVRETVDLFRQEAQARGIPLRTEVAEDLPDALRGDPLRIRQVLMNLLSNAVKFTPANKASDGAEIVVRIEPENGHWHCAVIDPGVGMTAATVERLFEPFSQADTTLVRNSEGSGLGLAICRQLVVAMGGEICCESERGKGSTFHFVLPLRAARGRDTGAVEIPEVRFQGHVLVVDDEAVNRHIARAHLEALGLEVTEASGGEEALERLAAETFDLVLTDLRMPTLDGVALTRRWRRVEGAERTRVPIVAVTAQGGEEEALWRQAGIDDHLPKPFRRAALAAMLRRWLPIATPPEPGESEASAAGPPPGLRHREETRAALEALGRKTGEDEVAKAITAFRQSSDRHLKALAAAWRAGDWEATAEHLHGLSGSAEFLGGMEVVTTIEGLRARLATAARVDEAVLDHLRRQIDQTIREFSPRAG